MIASYDWMCEIAGEGVDDETDLFMIDLARQELKTKMKFEPSKSSEVVPSIKFTTYTDGMGFNACIGDYDLDCHEGHGKTPLEAIQDLLNSHIDDLEE